jgi:DNA-binding CsgD family transcriptional regulator
MRPSPKRPYGFLSSDLPLSRSTADKLSTYLRGVKTPSSLRQLLRDLHLASGAPPSWLILFPDSRIHQFLWTKESDGSMWAVDPAEVVRVAARIPQGGHFATAQAPWASQLFHALFGGDVKPEDSLILPFHHGHKLIACVGWIAERQDARNVTANLPAVRRTLQTAWTLEVARTECHALKWVLSRCDRMTGAVRPAGEIVAFSPAAADFVKSIQMGPCHYFHAGDPELPSPLLRAMAGAPVGQVKLSKSCTARFDPIGFAPTSWLPLIGIELFVEKAPHSMRGPLPTSLLTPVERQVYSLIKLAKTNREICDIRGTAFATTKNQVSAILAKMGVSRRHHLLLDGAGPMNSPSQLHKPGMKGVTSSTR